VVIKEGNKVEARALLCAGSMTAECNAIGVVRVGVDHDEAMSGQNCAFSVYNLRRAAQDNDTNASSQ
jgi:hypothetical protein